VNVPVALLLKAFPATLPPDIWSVELLLAVHDPLLLIVAPDIRIQPPVQLAVPSTVSVRPSRYLVPVPSIVSVPPAASTVLPLPFIVPPDQCSVPLTVRSPAPDMEPLPDKVRSASISDAAPSARLPPLMVSDSFDVRL
jgi:hypothetical protein